MFLLLASTKLAHTFCGFGLGCGLRLISFYHCWSRSVNQPIRSEELPLLHCLNSIRQGCSYCVEGSGRHAVSGCTTSSVVSHSIKLKCETRPARGKGNRGWAGPPLEREPPSLRRPDHARTEEQTPGAPKGVWKKRRGNRGDSHRTAGDDNPLPHSLPPFPPI